jgi:hypothetical protein
VTIVEGLTARTPSGFPVTLQLSRCSDRGMGHRRRAPMMGLGDQRVKHATRGPRGPGAPPERRRVSPW